jgi:glycosylphosphatidylinositol transamidase (GPIT) subunit GPI8
MVERDSSKINYRNSEVPISQARDHLVENLLLLANEMDDQEYANAIRSLKSRKTFSIKINHFTKLVLNLQKIIP